MIGTGINKRIQVQDIIDNQLPEFITSESPLTSDFLKQYAITLSKINGEQNQLWILLKIYW